MEDYIRIILEGIPDLNMYLNRISRSLTFAEKLKIAQKALKFYNVIEEKFYKFFIENSAKKNDQASQKLRTLGNEVFEAREYFSALKFYNMSLCCAELNNTNIPAAYGNRSAVLFEIECYDECLENIKMARAAGYPEKFSQKLNDREKRAKQLMRKKREGSRGAASRVKDEMNNNNNSNKDYAKLNYPPHPKIPYIVDCLEMIETPEMGRGIFTKRSLCPGDVIATEESLLLSICENAVFIVCTNCCKESAKLIPCKGCTFAMFCSEKCEIEATTRGSHKYICKYSEMLCRILSDFEYAALRLTLMSLSLFETAEQWMAFCNDPDNQRRSVFSIDHENLTTKEYFKTILGLKVNENLEAFEIFVYSVKSIVITKYLCENDQLWKDTFITDKIQKFFMEFLLRAMFITNTNVGGIVSPYQMVPKNIAFTILPFENLINHSCAPNIGRIYNGTMSVLFATRPICAGEEIFSNYGFKYLNYPTEYRRLCLMKQYGFICKCEACIKNYPVLNDLKSYPKIPNIINSSELRPCLTFDRDFAKKKIKDFRDILIKYKQYYPCIQLVNTENHIPVMVAILNAPKPSAFSFFLYANF